MTLRRQRLIKLYITYFLFIFVFYIASFNVDSNWFFSFFTRRWHVSPFGFIWFLLNHINKILVEPSNLLKTVYEFESHMWDVLLPAWPVISHSYFLKACYKFFYWKEVNLILNLDELHILYHLRGCNNFFVFFLLLIFFIKITENKL